MSMDTSSYCTQGSIIKSGKCRTENTYLYLRGGSAMKLIEIYPAESTLQVNPKLHRM